MPRGGDQLLLQEGELDLRRRDHGSRAVSETASASTVACTALAGLSGKSWKFDAVRIRDIVQET